jgi:hypothetical protein
LVSIMLLSMSSSLSSSFTIFATTPNLCYQCQPIRIVSGHVNSIKFQWDCFSSVMCQWFQIMIFVPDSS